MTTYFESVFGFAEKGRYDAVRDKLISAAGGLPIVLEKTSKGHPVTFTLPFLSPGAKGAATSSRVVHAGTFSTPSVRELREAADAMFGPPAAANGGGHGRVELRNIVGDSLALHCDSQYFGAVFQAASQFNCLEFVSASGVPENGIGVYELDHTQGPACAIACGAGTAVRNYLAVVDAHHHASVTPHPWLAAGRPCAAEEVTTGSHAPGGGPGASQRPPTATLTADEVGQRRHRQINNLHDAHLYLAEQVAASPLPSASASGPTGAKAASAAPTGAKKSYAATAPPLLDITNGYVESTKEQLTALNALLAHSASARDEAIARMRIGVMYDTEVTARWSGGAAPPPPAGGSSHRVTQTFNSAISIGYSKVPHAKWEPLARMVLEASYEATLLAGVLNAKRHAVKPRREAAQVGGGRTGSATLVGLPPVVLTKIGGGVFRNDSAWIQEAIKKACASVAPRLAQDEVLRVYVTHFGRTETGYSELDF